MPKVFIDSNTFLYSIQINEPTKRSKARDWLRRLSWLDAGVTNLQVLNETTNVILRKAASFEDGDPFDQVSAFEQFGNKPISAATSRAARFVRRSFRYAWWDCILLTSALELGCSHFLSEDLQDGQAIDGLTIIDPFAHSPEEILAS